MWIADKTILSVTTSMNLWRKRQALGLTQLFCNYGSWVWEKGCLYTVMARHNKCNYAHTVVEASPVEICLRKDYSEPNCSQSKPGWPILFNVTRQMWFKVHFNKPSESQGCQSQLCWSLVARSCLLWPGRGEKIHVAWDEALVVFLGCSQQP